VRRECTYVLANPWAQTVGVAHDVAEGLLQAGLVQVCVCPAASGLCAVLILDDARHVGDPKDGVWSSCRDGGVLLAATAGAATSKAGPGVCVLSTSSAVGTIEWVGFDSSCGLRDVSSDTRNPKVLQAGHTVRPNRTGDNMQRVYCSPPQMSAYLPITILQELVGLLDNSTPSSILVVVVEGLQVGAWNHTPCRSGTGPRS
jgi:hypothetical protein